MSDSCKHKFIDSNHCLKCGWTPPGALAAPTGSAIDVTSDDWQVFCGHWFVMNGTNPHPRDSRVLMCWAWFRSGESWGERKPREPETPQEWQPMLRTGDFQISLYAGDTLEIRDGQTIYVHLTPPETSDFLRWIDARDKSPNTDYPEGKA